MDDLPRQALDDGHIQRGQHELRPQVCGHGPSHHAAAPDVEDDREVEKPRPGGHVRDVGHPEPVGALRLEVALDEIGRGLGRRVPRRGEDGRAPAHPLHARGAHEARHPLAADVVALGRQLGVHRGAPYVPRDSRWMVWIFMVNAASCCARAEGARRCHA